MHGTAALAQASLSPEAVAEYVGGLLDLQEWRFEYGSLRSHPPRLDSDGSIAEGHSALDVEQAGLPPELELRVVGNGQYYGRFLMRPRPGARPTLQARLVAVALAQQVGHAYSAARRPGVPADSPAWHRGDVPACGDALACGPPVMSRVWRGSGTG